MKKPVTCLMCKKEFIHNTGKSRGKFCSVKCSLDYQKTNLDYKKEKQLSKLKSLGKTEGSNYRNKALIHHNYTCQRCNKSFDKKDLVIHHIDGQHWNNEIENLVVLCKPHHDKLHRGMKKKVSLYTGEVSVKNAIGVILKALKLDLTSPDYLDTPNRVARVYKEMCYGLFPEAQEEIQDILATKFPSEYDGMVITQDITVWSLCPHHLLPVKYTIAVGIVTEKYCIGLSKIPRLVELLAKKPVLQETLTHEVTEILGKELEPLGVICQIEGEHTCMQARGVKAFGTKVTTSSVTGVFLNPTENKNPKTEFFNAIK